MKRGGGGGLKPEDFVRVYAEERRIYRVQVLIGGVWCHVSGEWYSTRSGASGEVEEWRDEIDHQMKKRRPRPRDGGRKGA